MPSVSREEVARNPEGVEWNPEAVDCAADAVDCGAARVDRLALAAGCAAVEAGRPPIAADRFAVDPAALDGKEGCRLDDAGIRDVDGLVRDGASDDALPSAASAGAVAGA